MRVTGTKLKYTSVLLIGLIAGLAGGWVVHNITKAWLASINIEKHAYDAQYSLINPLLECSFSEDVTPELRNFKYKVEKLTKQIISSGKASHISVYFRDLNNGPWLGIEEKTKFSPASLLKVSFMMTALKKEMDSPGFLGQKVVYKGGFANDRKDIKSETAMEVGKSYSLSDVVYHMIVYSNNDAMNILLSYLSEKEVQKTYSDLGITPPTPNMTDNFLNIKEYSSLFRVLFNASYLNKGLSNWALDTLSQSEFSAGLSAGVPKNITVAHKFGERDYLGKKQLHDCGVIYYPTHPYLLCIMNRGGDWEILSSNIADISKLVYEEVDGQFQ